MERAFAGKVDKISNRKFYQFPLKHCATTALEQNIFFVHNRQAAASCSSLAAAFLAIPHKLAARIQPENFRRKKAVFRGHTMCAGVK